MEKFIIHNQYTMNDIIFTIHKLSNIDSRLKLQKAFKLIHFHYSKIDTEKYVKLAKFSKKCLL
jgi:hypothetical protein